MGDFSTIPELIVCEITRPEYWEGNKTLQSTLMNVSYKPSSLLFEK